MSEGSCFGQYTEAARRAGVEGTVILDVVIGADGSVREVAVVQGLSHGLNAAAVQAIETCRFSPGMRAGKPVAVRVRGFRVNFVLKEAK
jgi:periplasmic protein TonB